ncbi:Uma2 family endonuclease [Sorangium sp. So ce1000]|uniref:Uma2 family endonuclease n=1 Tax=Sorangium sp. So ce1000 TaxID=3133325 RepID=UPI003F6252EB
MGESTQSEAFRRAREEASKLATTIASAINLMGLLACPRAAARVPDDGWPHREVLVDELEAYLAYLVHARGARGEWDLQMLASEPYALRLRSLLMDWNTSSAIPVEITRAARDCLEALGIPEPPLGWDAFEGFQDAATPDPRPSQPQAERPEDVDCSLQLVDRLSSIPHVNASSALGVELGGAFQRGRGGPGGWWILDAPTIRLPSPAPLRREEILVPDLAGWRRERLSHLPKTAHVTVAPDWACEVLSPTTEACDREQKMPVYAREGVRWVWLLDPDARVLEIYSLTERSGWQISAIYRDNALVRAEPFDAIDLDLAVLWT